MLILMKNYGVFTKFVVLQEPKLKEEKRGGKAAKKTKVEAIIVVIKPHFS